MPYRPCVGVLLVNHQGNIFVGERLDTPGAWQMPQGGIDKDEAPDAAALRELEEEIGVPPHAVSLVSRTRNWITYDLPDHLKGKAWGGKYAGQKQLWFKMQLTASDDVINIQTDHPEFSRWKWTTADDLLTQIVEFKRQVYEQVIAELLI